MLMSNGVINTDCFIKRSHDVYVNAGLSKCVCLFVCVCTCACVRMYPTV